LGNVVLGERPALSAFLVSPRPGSITGTEYVIDGSPVLTVGRVDPFNSIPVYCLGYCPFPEYML